MTTHILGINAFHADAAAVLLRDGEVVGAIAEERLNRVKHFAGFPKLSILKLLEMGKIGIEDVDHIAIGRDSTANLSKKLGFALTNLSRITKLAKQRLENRAQVKDVPALVAAACGVEVKRLRAKVHNIEHHLCHAASAYLPSEMERAAILSIDGFGDFASTMIAVGRGRDIEILDRVYFPHSLGILYTAICQFIGYGKYGDEGKVMGLAPYGEPAYMDLMHELVTLKPNGKFELGLDWFVHHTEGVDYSFDDDGNPTVAPLYSQKLIDRLGAPRERGTEISKRDKDLTRSLQARFEEAYFHVVNDLQAKTGLDAICVAGGVALNSVANGMMFTRSKFRRFATHPAAGDDGTAFGAAFYVHNCVLGNARVAPLNHAYFGDEFSDLEMQAALDKAGVKGAVRLDDEALFPRVAERIAAGKVVGWFQGRMEWGPRALGSRSILAHPGRADMKDILNARIKHREWFRPFAPSILEEAVADYFDESHPSPYMMLVYTTKPERRADIQATDHVDHTGRLQTVSRKDSPRYHRVISEFRKVTGIPVVLNTSFNENEPIVRTPAEAIDCFLRTKMDVLALGNWLVDKD
ncbi:MAG: carbamoyltransferase [Deltaproteobacteria bacterium]|nr:carbamoyltransferase [Deltaproteobacteria bacterium]